jgi:hypothetical protein
MKAFLLAVAGGVVLAGSPGGLTRMINTISMDQIRFQEARRGSAPTATISR